MLLFVLAKLLVLPLILFYDIFINKGIYREHFLCEIAIHNLLLFSIQPLCQVLKHEGEY